MPRTLPKVRITKRMEKVDPPVYRELVRAMGFDPANAPNMHWQPWLLEQTYPPSAGELMGTLTGVMTPPLFDDGQEDEDDKGNDPTEAGGPAAAAL